MKKTLNINLGGFNFHVDEDAFSKLERYLATLKLQFAKTQGGHEIVNDVEMRLAELFKEYTTNKEVVDLQDVAQAVSVLGEPEDYIDGEAETTDEETSYESTEIPPHLKASRKIYRDSDDRILGGVAAGLAAYFNIDSFWTRLIFIALFFAGFGFFLYIILWIVVPKAKTTAEKLQMRGEPVTLSNIEKAIKEEASQVGKNFKSFSQEARFVGRSGQKKAGNFLRDFGQLLGDLFRLIFKIISKILGFLFLAIGFIFLFGLLIALITGSVEISGIGYGLSDVLAFAENVTASPGHYNAGLIGISLLVLAPLFLLVYYGIRILFKVEPLNKQVRGSLALLTVVGLALTIYAGVRTAIEFNKESSFTTTVEIPRSPQTLNIALLKDSIYDDFANYDFEAHWQQYDTVDAFYGVDFDVRQSRSSQSYLQIKTSAHGSNRKQASVKAQKVNYPILLENNQLVLPLYYLLQGGEKFRGQEVDLTLFLVPGDTIRLEQGMEQIIDGIANINRYYDWDMINHTWLMTENGLLCTDCPDTEAVLEKQRQRNIEEEQQMKKNPQGEETKAVNKIEEQVKSTILEINQNGVTLKI